MKRPLPRWEVPIASIGVGVSIEIDQHGNVQVWTPNSEVGPDTLTPVEACQLGQALQEASREAATRRKR